MAAAAAARSAPSFGVLYRRAFHAALFATAPAIDVLELVADHYFTADRRTRAELAALAERYTIVLHALETSVGSAGGIDERYVRRVARVAELVRPRWWSDHLAFSRVGRTRLGAFAPLPHTDDALEVVCRNVERARRIVGLPFALENPAAPFSVAGATYTPGAFSAAVAEGARCGLVLDVENLHADECNLGTSARAAIDAVAPETIWEVHLAGGYVQGGEYVDAHARAVSSATWELYRYACARGIPPVTIVEREADVPPLAQLAGEVSTARTIACAA